MGNSTFDNKLYVLVFCLFAGAALSFMGAEKTRQKRVDMYSEALDDSADTDITQHSLRKRRSSRQQNHLESSSKPNFDYISTPTFHHDNGFVSEDTSTQPLIASQVKLDKKKKSKNKKRIAGMTNSESSSRHRKSNSLSQMNGSSSNNGTVISSALQQKEEKKEKEENLDSIEFWIDPIFNKLEIAAVMKLVESYQIKRVSAQVFYTVVDDMNHDERQELREFGLFALSATPSSKSFSQLAWIKHNDSEASIRTSANRQVASYIDPSKLTYIVSALRSSSQGETGKNSSLEAMKIVRAATEKYAGQSPLQDKNPTTKTPVNVQQAISKIAQAANVITVSQLKSSDATIKAEAQKTIDTVQRYINL